MQRKIMVGFRANPDERTKLEEFAEVTGRKMSEVLRELVRNATIKQEEVVQTSTVLTVQGEVNNG